MSLIGTEYNCAGGATPWGSWLSCEECFTDPDPVLKEKKLLREKNGMATYLK